MSILMLLRRVEQDLLDLVFPPRCFVCRQPGTPLCDDCRQGFPRVTSPICQLCGQPADSVSALCWRCRQSPLAIDGIRSVVLFEDGVRQAIHRLKYRNQRSLAMPLAQLMADYWEENQKPVDLIMAVPLHPSRLRERGYNQADLLAQALGRMLSIPVQSTGLKRVRNTRSQMKLNLSERILNMRDAFAYQASGNNNATLNGRRVLVVDDVCTTGSTLEACSISLKAAGALSVWGFTLARAVLARDR